MRPAEFLTSETPTPHHPPSPHTHSPSYSGKSNLMDAISFVLGVRSAQLRGVSLRDLVYGNKEDPGHASRRASVTLVLRSSEVASSELHFGRSIAPAGTSEYRVGGRVVSAEAYNEQLKAQGILVKARNFLVFQGDVQNIASKEPVQLTAMLEEVSGSGELKADYEAAEAAKVAAEERASFNFGKRKSLMAEKRQKREQKEEAEKHINLLQELVRPMEYRCRSPRSASVFSHPSAVSPLPPYH